MAGFKKAVRENIWAKVLTIAPSGGGKSYGALRLAKGLTEALEKDTGVEERIAYIGTEGSRDKYYADEFDYDLLQLKAPFTPESFIDAIDEAIDSGYKVIVIDSITHEWTGKGGILEIHSKMSGNSYTNWSKLTPRHEKFVDKILDSEAFIIATVRGKDKYVLEEQNGKQVPRKVGVGYQQRDDLEFLFTVALTIEQDTHLFTSVKDNTHFFENRNDILTEKDGEIIYKWATGGDVKAKRAELEKSKEEAKAKIALNQEEEAKKIAKDNEKKHREQLGNVTLEELKSDILIKCKELSDQGKRAEVIETLKNINGSANPNDITSKSVAEKIIKEFKVLEA
jgi:hypothetical protein